MPLGALLLADVSDKKKPRAASARTLPHKYEALYAHVLAERDRELDGPLIIDWDERYVHAIERALTGRKPDELLKLLDDRHPPKVLGLKAAFYTSPSHTPEKPRWRVIAPLSVSASIAHTLPTQSG